MSKKSITKQFKYTVREFHTDLLLATSQENQLVILLNAKEKLERLRNLVNAGLKLITALETNIKK